MRNENINLRGTLYVTDWLSGIRYAGPDDAEIVQVLFKNTHTAFYRNTAHIPLAKGDWVAVEAAPGHDIGQVMLTGPLVRMQMKKANVSTDSELKKIFRKATEADMEKFEEARLREHETMIRSRQIAAELGLNMKIGDVEYQGDGAKAIFYYIADERVDFRKLIRILADTFKIRIEMKQIGARQEAGRIGGIGPCGRPLCCSSWMSKFVSVGTGAARIQDLSMNPQKLAGQCGKLKCCLNFETDTYAEASRKLPPRDAVLLTQDSEFYQFKVDILSHTITYSSDKHLAANLVTIPASRAFEIINLNKQGVKVEHLEAEKVEAEPPKEYVEIVGQDSLTRFDKSGKNRKRRKTKGPEPAREHQKQGDAKGGTKGAGGNQKIERRQNAPQQPRQKQSRKQNDRQPQPAQPKPQQQAAQQPKPQQQAAQQPKPQQQGQPTAKQRPGQGAPRPKGKRPPQNPRKNGSPKTEHQANDD